jgi:acetyltransferase-like isoleucine patch superfamily enzyme
MNLNYWLRRLSGRATCRLGAGAILASEARILNASGSSSNILIGNHSIVRGEIFVFAHGGSVTLGEWCFVGQNSRLWSAGRIDVGNRVLISHNVSIFDSLTHPMGPKARHAQCRAIKESGHPGMLKLAERSVIIEDDAWIGAGAIILRGVRVGACSVVGAGAVVSEDVPAGVIVSGNPACVRRALTATELSS